MGEGDGPAVVLRAELDGLPIVETTGVPWASGNGAMHACGHDVHLAGLACAVRAAQRLELPRPLAVLLQPREEGADSGARDAVDEGRSRVSAPRSPRTCSPGCRRVWCRRPRARSTPPPTSSRSR